MSLFCHFKLFLFSSLSFSFPLFPSFNPLYSPLLSFSPEDRLRLLLLYIAHVGKLSPPDRTSLLDRAGLSASDRRAVAALEYLLANRILPDGVPATFPANSSEGGKEDKKKKKSKQKALVEENAYDDSRYVPHVKRILTQFADGALDPSEYPFVIPTTTTTAATSTGVSMRGGKGASSSAPRGQNGGKGRVILVIVGGMTYAEMRAAYMFAGREVVIGSDAVLRPEEFVEELRRLPVENVGTM